MPVEQSNVLAGIEDRHAVIDAFGRWNAFLLDKPALSLVSNLAKLHPVRQFPKAVKARSSSEVIRMIHGHKPQFIHRHD